MALLWHLEKMILKCSRTVGKWPNPSHLIRLKANVVYGTADFMHFPPNCALVLSIIPSLLQGICFIFLAEALGVGIALQIAWGTL